MSSGVKVQCSGAFLSSLKYNHLQHGQIQEGFLLGQLDSHIRELISDSHICNEETETTINLSSFIPCPTLGSFYSGTGRVNLEKLKVYLGSNYNNVIGWYRYRSTNVDDIYLREMRVHQQLHELFTHAGGNFLFALFSFTPCNSNGILSLSHKFMLQRNKSFEGVSLKIENMGDTSTSDYIIQPTNPALSSCSSIKSVLNQISTVEPGVREAEMLHYGLLKQLDEILPKYNVNQERYHKSLQEVLRLRKLCYKNNISPDYFPESIKIEEKNLMDFSESSGLAPQNSQNRLKKSPLKQITRKKSGSQEPITPKKPSDPFGFVNSEMEKLQVKSSPRSRSSSAKDPKEKFTRNSSAKFSDIKDSHLSSESPPSSPRRVRSKVTRSKLDTDPSPNKLSRGRSPAKVKSKVKEAWAKKTSESQEY